MKKHFNSLPAFSATQNINVDREQGILRNVEVAKFGKNKNRTYFNAKFLQDLVEHGNAQKNGVKSRFGHPAMCGNSLGTFIGRQKNYHIINNKVFADIHLDEVAKKTQIEGKGISMFEYIMDMAERNPDMFGVSIVINGDTYEEKVLNDAGKPESVESFVLESFVACDFVDDPAATDALFSNNPEDLGVIITNFLDANPKIFAVIDKNPEMIADFFERYANYSNRNPNSINMKFNFSKFFGKTEKFNKEVTLANGDIVTVVTEAEQAAEGDLVTDAEGKPVIEGEHLLPDGSAIVTDAKGIITEIKAKPENEDPKETEVVQPIELMNSVNALNKKFDTMASQFSTFMKAFEKDQKENESGFEGIMQSFESFDKRLNLLGKEIKGKKPEEFQAEGTGGINTKNEPKTSGYDSEKANAHRTKNN